MKKVEQVGVSKSGLQKSRESMPNKTRVLVDPKRPKRKRKRGKGKSIKKSA
jgi:hypothetical protein